MAAVAGVAFLVCLFLPASVIPPDRLPLVASGFTTLIGLAASADTRQRARGRDSDK